MTTGELRAIAPTSPVARRASKVPQVTVLFWVVKVLTTGMGETTSDFLVRKINPFVAVVIGGVAFAVALALQFAVRRYVPWIYWLAVVMVSVFGTMAADVLHVGLGIPYAVSATFYLVVLAAILVVWHRTEGTLSITSVRGGRPEFFYWATVLATFALGTAAGDLTSIALKWGFFASGVLFAVAIAVPAVAHRTVGLNAVAAFWIAYILTRPVGACFADWAAVAPHEKGLGFGYGTVSIGLGVLIVALVGYLQVAAGRAAARR
jgi:uncharacterized membrane-anchored protein